MKYMLLCSLFLLALHARGQQSDTGYVNIHADSRLAVVTSKTNTASRPFIGKIKGFRVQIYNGNDRRKASQIKLDFMKQFPGIRSYLAYNNPQFRVRVGDFRTRKEATELYNRLTAKFTPCMIVPDIVNVNTARKIKDNSADSND